MKVTKASIVEELHEMFQHFGYERKRTFDIVETLIEIIKRELEQGNDVLISGFGKFQVRDKKARQGRNPATGESMTITPRRIVTFKYSGKLRDQMNDENKRHFIKGARRIDKRPWKDRIGV